MSVFYIRNEYRHMKIINKLCGSLNLGGIWLNRVLFQFMPVGASAHFRLFYSSVAEIIYANAVNRFSLTCIKIVDKCVL